MGNVLIDEGILQGWGDVIREKQGIEDLMKPSVLLEKTREIESGGQGGSETDYGLQLINKTIEEIPQAWKDNVTKIPPYAFQDCFDLAEVDFPNATEIGGSAFASTQRTNGPKFTKVNLPNATKIGGRAFQTYNSAGYGLYLPKVTTIESYACSAAWGLRYAILPKIANIPLQVFFECTACCVVLPQNSVVSLANANYNGQKGTYVPKALLEDYKNATNWSASSNVDKIFAIEDSEEILALLEEVGYEYVSTEV